jgi:peptidylprolyl isomerase
MGTEKRQRQKERRQARLEAERAAAARAQRRKRLITAVVVTIGIFVLLVALTWNAGRDDEETEVATDDTTTTTAAPEVDLSEKPEVTVPEGEDPPTELVIEDLEEGDGAEVEEGDTITAHYVGVAWSTGEEFDSSWERGEPTTFPLDGVIQGWGEGLVGMREGGQRRLVIPPELGYGEGGSGAAIGPNETLVFVVDLVSVDG